MRRFGPLLPTPAMAVALTALFVALGGTGYAASQLPGGSAAAQVAKKKKQKQKQKAPDELSQDSRVFFTQAQTSARFLGIGGTAIKALRADSATNAGHASSADSATNAGTATNALSLGGNPPASFETAGHFQTSGVIALTATGAGSTQPLITIGPITYTERCTDTGGGNFKAELLETSNEPGAVTAGPYGESVLTASQQVLVTATGTTATGFNFLAQALTPSGLSYQDSEFLAVHTAGHDCVARINVFTP